MPEFDRVPEFDPRSRAFGVGAPVRPLRAKVWRCLARLNQGEVSGCVGFGITHALGTGPHAQPVSRDLALSVYELALTLDEFPGEADTGTSVLAGCKAAKRLGRIVGYRWCFGLDAVLDQLAWGGAVVLGLTWREGMEEPDANGVVRNAGAVLGGHCVDAHGLHLSDELVRIRNSRGRAFGRRGDEFVSFSDLGALLGEDGEAVVLVR